MTNEDFVRRFIPCFHSGILSVFHAQADKYEVSTDDFWGKVRIRYQDRHEGTDGESCLNVAFGFRACKNGEWAIAAWGPDLATASVNEKRIWTGFQIDEQDLVSTIDPRFQRWLERNIEGSWEVKDGPIARLDNVIRQINAITKCVVDLPLFDETDIRSLCFPVAENNHRYHDAHSEVYKHLQDSLNKYALAALGKKFGVEVKPGDRKTVVVLKQLLPEHLCADVTAPLDVVSNRRALADHDKRPPPEGFPAFEEFNRDMCAIVSGLEILRNWLSERLSVDLESCEARAAALEQLPQLDDNRPPEAHYSICNAAKIQGKRVVRAKGGYRTQAEGHADTEALVLEFEDGSILGIDPVSNVGQLVREGASLKPNGLHITLWVTFVPPLLPNKNTKKEGVPD